MARTRILGRDDHEAMGDQPGDPAQLDWIEEFETLTAEELERLFPEIDVDTMNPERESNP